MVRCRLRYLRLAKEDAEKRRLSYRTIAAETGLSYGTISRLMNNQFDRIETDTIAALCAYFRCGVGDLLEIAPPD